LFFLLKMTKKHFVDVFCPQSVTDWNGLNIIRFALTWDYVLRFVGYSCGSRVLTKFWAYSPYCQDFSLWLLNQYLTYVSRLALFEPASSPVLLCRSILIPYIVTPFGSMPCKRNVLWRCQYQIHVLILRFRYRSTSRQAVAQRLSVWLPLATTLTIRTSKLIVLLSNFFYKQFTQKKHQLYRAFAL